MYFKSIEDILNSGILSERISEGFSDNVLKSTRLEREIFRDIRDKTPEIKEFETEGRQYLSSIKQLINDVFQAFYTITPKMLVVAAGAVLLLWPLNYVFEKIANRLRGKIEFS